MIDVVMVCGWMGVFVLGCVVFVLSVFVEMVLIGQMFYFLIGSQCEICLGKLFECIVIGNFEIVDVLLFKGCGMVMSVLIIVKKLGVVNVMVWMQGGVVMIYNV